MQVHLDPFFVRVLVQVVDAIRIECAGLANKPMNFIFLVEQELSQVRSILTRNTGYQSLGHKFTPVNW